MADISLLRSSPLSALRNQLAAIAEETAGAVTLRERSFLCQIRLHGSPADPAFMTASRGVLGCAPPVAENTVASADGRSILWLGPQEWLIVSPDDSKSRLLEALVAALAGLGAAATDVSAARTVIELNGTRAREVLMKGCGLDLHPRAFRPGQCAQTLLARAGVILEQIDASPAYRLFVPASYAPYLASWLIDAAGEYKRHA